MDDSHSLDSVERVESYTTTQRVKRSHQSTEEKEQKFASALKDKMEEEKRRKRKAKDEVILAESAEAPGETTPEAAPQATEKDDDSESEKHIDLTA